MTLGSTTGCSCPSRGVNLFTPMIASAPLSMRACFRVALSSILRLGMPEATAAAIPPSASTSSITSLASRTSSSVSASIMYEPPHGSTTAPTPLSSARMSCVLRASDAENSVGRPIASSNEFVCSDCVPPITAAIASTVVRMMLLYGSWAVSDQPEVWQCVRSMSERLFFGLKFFSISVAHRRRAARSFAISMYMFIEMPKKKEMRGAMSSTPTTPVASAARTYSIPSASVNASSSLASAPASCMW
mmetsp:Transcript_32342/g.70869  ORF Transcript_32342/g.70869 Transcript_32342/m.70869 type:complete len:246 (-) Transcript_32342:928-1665(-)